MIDVRDRDPPARHRQLLTPSCSKCGGMTNPTMIFPSGAENLVWYRCEKCGTEFRQAVRRISPVSDSKR
jgi:tRNA(Ile2) C34 agmatinyltransferase TiaS